MEILEGLNPEQRAAVEHRDGPMLVVAGAGTGKTQVITRRIAQLIATGAAKPAEILALTFTDKAAREMEERLHGLIGWDSFQVPVMTFHAFGTELLSRFASHVGRSVRGGLLNETQKTLLLQQHFSEIELRYYGPQADVFEFLDSIVSYIGSLQNAGVTVGRYRQYVDGLVQNPGEMHPRDVDEQRDLLALYELYERVKETTGTFDYNDQLQIPLSILQQRSNLADRLAHEYRYVLVDEYQDTNTVQDELLRTFVGPTGNLFAVGDDDQAIYGFRGAEIGNILAFAEHFKLARPVVLSRNYRSGQAILDAAYRSIQHNDPERLEAKLGLNKRLIALHDESVVSYTPYVAPTDELQGVLDDIQRRLDAGEAAGSMAVLAATHAPLRAIAKAMRTRQIPFALSTSVNIFEQPELIGLWYLLDWIGMRADDEAIGHVVMGPMVGWQPAEYREVAERARLDLSTVEAALRLDEREACRQLMAQLDAWRAWAKELPVSQLVFKLIFETGKADEWRERAAENGRMIRVFEDLQRLLEQMQDFETVAVDPTLMQYLRMFPKPPVLEVSEPVGDSEGVQLLTVHASKGLEFEVVYLIGCTQRTWSGARGGGGLRVPDELHRQNDLPPEHELRRLMYVAVTRAKRTLNLSSAVQTVGGMRQVVSSFVAELLGDEALTVEPKGVKAAANIEKTMNKLQRYYPMQAAGESERLPFETADGWLELGVTSLGSYEYCPFEFYLTQVLGIKQPMGPQLAFGNVLHGVLERHYKGLMAGTERPPDELHALLDEQWTDRGYESREEAARDLALAHDTLRLYLGRKESGKILASEMPIRFELADAKLRLRGKIDAIFAVDGGVELRDFKTGRTKTDAEKLSKEAKNSLQLRTYALAYEQLNGQVPAVVTLDYIVTGVEGSAELSAAVLRNHRTKLAVLADRIRQRDFAPNPSPMHACAAIRYYGTGEQEALTEQLMSEGR